MYENTQQERKRTQKNNLKQTHRFLQIRAK